MKKETKQKLRNYYKKLLAGRHYKDSNTKIIEERIKELKKIKRLEQREKDFYEE